MDRSLFFFVTIHAFDRQTDGRTDRRTTFSSLVRVGIPCSEEKTKSLLLQQETFVFWHRPGIYVSSCVVCPLRNLCSSPHAAVTRGRHLQRQAVTVHRRRHPASRLRRPARTGRLRWRLAAGPTTATAAAGAVGRRDDREVVADNRPTPTVNR